MKDKEQKVITVVNKFLKPVVCSNVKVSLKPNSLTALAISQEIKFLKHNSQVIYIDFLFKILNS